MPELDLKLLAERVGLEPTAAPDQVIAKTYALAEALKDMEGDRDRWRALAEKSQAENVQYKKSEEELRTTKSALFIEEAIRMQYIDAAERDDMIALHKIEPDRVKRIIDGRRKRAYLATESGFDGGEKAPSALVEIEGRAAELMAKDQKLTKAQAQSRVLAEDSDLAERYRLEVVAGAKGGDR